MLLEFKTLIALIGLSMLYYAWFVVHLNIEIIVILFFFAIYHANRVTVILNYNNIIIIIIFFNSIQHSQHSSLLGLLIKDFFCPFDLNQVSQQR